jgi:NADH-quinone oxidoreductase subunit N
MNSIIISGLLGVLLMLAGLVFNKTTSIKLLARLASVVIFTATVLDYYNQTIAPIFYYNKMMCSTLFTTKLNIIIAFGTMVYLFLFANNITKVGVHKAEYFALICFALCGVFILSSYQSLFMLFIGIEILSIPQYILAGSDKRNLKSNEASLKYFLMGAFSTGFLLMGIALIYGATHTFDINGIAAMIGENQKNIIALLGLVFLIVAFGFKVSAAPFHAWTPDVYDGSPTPFTPFMASIVKVAVFAAFIKLFNTSFVNIQSVWGYLILAIIVATLLIGNITAVYQQSVKRMLAYSSIAQAGFLLFAVYSSGVISQKGLLLYAAAYILASMGIFAVLQKMKDYTYVGFNGLAKTEPILAFTATVCLLSLAGIPLTGGFFAKYYMLNAALLQGMPIWIVIFAVLMAAISVYYYFNVIRAMYFEEPKEGVILNTSPEKYYKSILIINAIAIIILGIVPALATIF